MLRRLVLGLGLSVLTVLPGAPTSRGSTVRNATVAAWVRGWPMLGHDPQQTYRSPDVGPTHPRLLYTGFFSIRAISGNSTVYGVEGATPDVIVLAFAGLGKGKNLWARVIPPGSPAMALAPNGDLLVLPEAYTAPPTLRAYSATGATHWRITPFGFPEGAQPLVTSQGVFYAPAQGTGGSAAVSRTIGLNTIDATGRIVRRLAGATSAFAVAPNGTIYAYESDALRAVSAQGTRLWQMRNPGLTSGPLVGKSGAVTIGTGAWLLTYAPSGALLWRRRMPDGTLSLAERSDGTLLVAGRTRLTAIGANGRWRWGVPTGKTEWLLKGPSLIVDGAGTAYDVSGDGRLWVVSGTGKLLETLSVGGRTVPEWTPDVMMAPGGRLIVDGTDGLPRVYG